MSKPAIQAEHLHKTYHLGKVNLHVLRGVSLAIEPGEFVAIVGASGSGKSTLLHLIGLLDTPDRGQIKLADIDVAKLPPRRRNRIRCSEVGFVFQFYHLLGELDVLENVMLAAMVDSSLAAWPGRKKALRKKATELLETIGLGERLKHRPKELSGGERQRVAIARALMNDPDILLADEPTGNLDSRTGSHIMDLLGRMNKDRGQTILMVTHDKAIAAGTDRTLHLRDGKMVD